MIKEEQKIEKLLNSYEISREDVLSNFDHEINTDLEEKMKKKKIVSNYPAWNFHGKIWFDFKKKEFNCKIMQYHCFMEVIVGKTIKEIEEKASKKYGYL